MKLRCACGQEVECGEDTKKVTCERCVARMHTDPRQGKKKHKLTPRIRGAVRDCCNVTAGQCLATGQPCAVLDRRFCEWFQNAVVGEADAQTQLEYRQKFLGEKFVESRRCECGAVIGGRERLCDRCKRLHRRAAWRTEKQRQRTEGE